MAPALDEEVFISVAFTYEGEKAKKFVPSPPHWKSTDKQYASNSSNVNEEALSTLREDLNMLRTPQPAKGNIRVPSFGMIEFFWHTTRNNVLFRSVNAKMNPASKTHYMKTEQELLRTLLIIRIDWDEEPVSPDQPKTLQDRLLHSNATGKGYRTASGAYKRPRQDSDASSTMSFNHYSESPSSRIPDQPIQYSRGYANCDRHETDYSAPHSSPASHIYRGFPTELTSSSSQPLSKRVRASSPTSSHSSDTSPGTRHPYSGDRPRRIRFPYEEKQSRNAPSSHDELRVHRSSHENRGRHERYEKYPSRGNEKQVEGRKHYRNWTLDLRGKSAKNDADTESKPSDSYTSFAKVPSLSSRIEPLPDTNEYYPRTLHGLPGSPTSTWNPTPIAAQPFSETMSYNSTDPFVHIPNYAAANLSTRGTGTVPNPFDLIHDSESEVYSPRDPYFHRPTVGLRKRPVVIDVDKDTEAMVHTGAETSRESKLKVEAQEWLDALEPQLLSERMHQEHETKLEKASPESMQVKRRVAEHQENDTRLVLDGLFKVHDVDAIRKPSDLEPVQDRGEMDMDVEPDDARNDWLSEPEECRSARIKIEDTTNGWGGLTLSRLANTLDTAIVVDDDDTGEADPASEVQANQRDSHVLPRHYSLQGQEVDIEMPWNYHDETDVREYQPSLMQNQKQNRESEPDSSAVDKYPRSESERTPETEPEEPEEELAPEAQQQAQVEVQAGWGFRPMSWDIFRDSTDVELKSTRNSEELEELDVQEQTRFHADPKTDLEVGVTEATDSSPTQKPEFCNTRQDLSREHEFSDKQEQQRKASVEERERQERPGAHLGVESQRQKPAISESGKEPQTEILESIYSRRNAYDRAASESSIASSSASVANLLNNEDHDSEYEKIVGEIAVQDTDRRPTTDKGRSDAQMQVEHAQEPGHPKSTSTSSSTPAPPSLTSSNTLPIQLEAQTSVLAVRSHSLSPSIPPREDNCNTIPGLSSSPGPAYIPGLSSANILNESEDPSMGTLTASTSWASSVSTDATFINEDKDVHLHSPKPGGKFDVCDWNKDSSEQAATTNGEHCKEMGMNGIQIINGDVDMAGKSDASIRPYPPQTLSFIHYVPQTMQNHKATTALSSMDVDIPTPQLLPASWTPRASSRETSQVSTPVRETLPLGPQPTVSTSHSSSQPPLFSTTPLQLPSPTEHTQPSNTRPTPPLYSQASMVDLSRRSPSSSATPTSHSPVSPGIKPKASFPFKKKRKQADVEMEERSIQQEQERQKDKLVNELEERQKEVEAQYVMLQMEIEKRRQELSKLKNEKGKEKAVQENDEELPSKARAWGAQSPKSRTRQDDWDYRGDRDTNDYYDHEETEDSQNRNDNQTPRMTRKQREGIIRHLQEELDEVQNGLGEGMKRQDEIIGRLKELGAPKVTMDVMSQVAGTGRRMLKKSPGSDQEESTPTTEVSPNSEMLTKIQLQLAEKKLEAERRRRIMLEQTLQDIKKECREPFVVPALLEAFIMVSELSGGVKSGINSVENGISNEGNRLVGEV